MNRKHPLYSAWAGMVNRCYNPNNSSFGRYGARGVTVCERWVVGDDGLTGFQAFLTDMGERPSGRTLDRIDPMGPYSPTNCRWATIKEQRQNISKAGDLRMRAAMSEGVKRHWVEWKQTNKHRLELTQLQQEALQSLAQAESVEWPRSAMKARSYKSLVRLGLAYETENRIGITEAGIQWVSGGRPEKRLIPPKLAAPGSPNLRALRKSGAK